MKLFNYTFSRGERLLFIGYSLILVALFFYSFTQIDLSLALSRSEFLQNIVRSFQHVGYFDRPLSTSLYLFLIIALFVFYLLFLIQAHKKKLSKKFTWIVLLFTIGILAFSYNAFSYDLFNYIFDAKIVTYYQENPYEHKALDYPGDPMLSFMRWTHRVYPYGPVWLGITVPLSYVGFHFFLPTLFLFKALMVASFVGSLYFIGKIFQKVAPEKEVFGLLFFGLNPLVIIESLVSAHLDIVMIFFCLWSFYLLLRERYVVSYLLFFISIGIKFATGFLLPIYMWITYLQRKNKKISWNSVFLFSIILMVAAVIAATMRTTFQPWYLVLLLAFVAFLSYRYYILIPSIILSFAALLTYVPFLFTGNWDPPIPQILMNIYMSACLLSLLVVLGFLTFNRQKKIR